MPSPRISRRQALAALGALSLPLERLVAQASPLPAAPMSNAPLPPSLAGVPADLPNFQPLLEWIAAEHPPRSTFLDPQWRSLDAWKAAVRPRLAEKLGYAPAVKPVTAEVRGKEERNGFTVETVSISATPAYRIPARILVPTGRRGRLPAVLALHCHSGRYTWGHEKVVSAPGEAAHLTEFRRGTYGRPWAEELARRGFVVAVIDAFYFGERRLRVEDLAPERIFTEVKEAAAAARKAAPGTPEWMAATNRVCGFYEHHTAKALTAVGTTWAGVHVWDDRRTIDYLGTRADVDPARIGCAGLSGGGFRAALTIAADPRVKAACVTGWMTEFAAQLKHHLRHTWMIYVPGLYRELDLPDAAALHAPGALLVQQCRRDTLFPKEGMEGAVAKLEKIYAKAGIPERFKGSFHDIPHSFPPALQDEAFAWLERWL